MKRAFLSMLLLFPLAATAADLPEPYDLEVSWDPITVDDAGADLPGPVEKYRVYACDENEPIASVDGDQVVHLEEGVVTGTGSHCREVAAYIAPFEGPRGRATVVIVVPGEPSVRLQAIQ